ncbi:MAG: hypothetical protein NUV97_02055 [archaeon]|nr:hypothetical protein [archaeon]MCR4323735.1 hypothetical protein [Nanoarchaeota archaeon]
MAEKCALCKENIGTTFLEKLEGTLVRVGEGENSRKFYVCSGCQKEHKENLKEKISKL